MDIVFWNRVVNYCDANWKGSFSQADKTAFAREYLWAWNQSVQNKHLDQIIVTLKSQLKTDAMQGNTSASILYNTLQSSCEQFNLV